MLHWADYAPAIAIRRSAVPSSHVGLAVLLFKVERLIRLRAGYVRQRVSTAAAFSIWASALALWRSFFAHRVSTLLLR